MSHPCWQRGGAQVSGAVGKYALFQGYFQITDLKENRETNSVPVVMRIDTAKGSVEQWVTGFGKDGKVFSKWVSADSGD